ncbi:unknown [Ruminococcus sp. CAG:382]|nr:unknown [Ruminococcus sp. CAG:382]
MADGDIVKSGHTDYVADHCGFGGYAPQTVDLEHGGDAVFAHEIGVMVVADGNLLLEVEGAALYSADGDFADIVVIVNGGDEHLCGGFFVAFGRRDV